MWSALLVRLKTTASQYPYLILTRGANSPTCATWPPIYYKYMLVMGKKCFYFVKIRPSLAVLMDLLLWSQQIWIAAWKPYLNFLYKQAKITLNYFWSKILQEFKHDLLHPRFRMFCIIIFQSATRQAVWSPIPRHARALTGQQDLIRFCLAGKIFISVTLVLNVELSVDGAKYQIESTGANQ